MSYDLWLFPKREGESPESTARVLLADESQELNPGPAVPEKEQRKEALKRALQAVNPQLEQFPFGYQEIAEFEGITLAEAKRRHRHIELNGPDNGNGIQITLFDDSVSITVPYWHRGEAAQLVFREIAQYINAIQATTGYLTYDSQLERVIDPAMDTDMEEAIAGYTATVHKLLGAGPGKTTRKKPWWKLW
jgi:hypothetical protein